MKLELEMTLDLVPLVRPSNHNAPSSCSLKRYNVHEGDLEKYQVKYKVMLPSLVFLLARQPWRVLNPLFRGLGVHHSFVCDEKHTCACVYLTDRSPHHSGPQILHLKVRQLVRMISKLSSLKINDFSIFASEQCLMPKGLLNSFDSCLSSESCLDPRTCGFQELKAPLRSYT